MKLDRISTIILVNILFLSIGTEPMSISASLAKAETLDPLDSFDRTPQLESDTSEQDQNKTSTELMGEAAQLLDDDRPLEARSKLLRALQKDPKQYRADMMLAEYYSSYVGHFRLALRYVHQALAVFEEVNGSPPYSQYGLQLEHSILLTLLSQSRLDLDDYQGALAALDQFTSYGYNEDWYAGSRAWVLMKLGRVDEAITIARRGYLTMRTDRGRGQILNMLGILLSMTKERPTSLEVFKNAVAYELSQGVKGHPATPLNNAGEVYKEIFDDNLAESMWRRSQMYHDACEHVLPSLNLAILMIDQLKISEAAKAMDDFEGCIAKFPLKNGEEHKALVQLIRGRVALASGQPDQAIAHFEATLAKKQWFGKIGTSQDDLQASALISISDAHAQRAKFARFRLPDGPREYLKLLAQQSWDRTLAWWYGRRARQILISQLNNLEDLYVRNTDALIQYSTFGSVLAGIPPTLLKRRIDQIKADDDRSGSLPYYQSYLGESLLAHGQLREGFNLLNTSLKVLRPLFDDGLRLHILLLLLPYTAPGTVEYRDLAATVFELNKASLPLNGLQLPVRIIGAPKDIVEMLAQGPFLVDNTVSVPFEIEAEKEIGGGYILQFRSTRGNIGNLRVTSSSLREAVKKLIDELFSRG